MQLSRLPLSVFAFGIVFLTLWTIGVHIATFNALAFWLLYPLFLLAVAGGVFGAMRSALWRDIFGSDASRLPRLHIHTAALGSYGWQIFVAVGALVLAFLYSAYTQYMSSVFTPFWIVVLATSLFALLSPPKSALVEFTPETKGATHTGPGFLIIAGLMLAFYFLSSIPDADDALLLNMAVGAKQERSAIYLLDTMLGIPDLQFMKSTYRLESYQLLAALISDATGLEVIQAAHIVIPSLVCIWAASALSLIHVALFGRIWWITLLFHLGWLAALDGALESYGYHAIPRFIHGKGAYVTVMVPLIAYLAVFAIRQNSQRALILLAAVMIISLGMTANALYSAPLTAALTAAPMFLLGGWLQRLHCLRLIAVILYPALMVVILLVFDPPEPSEVATAGEIGGIFWGLLGANYAHFAGLCLMFGAAILGLFNPQLRFVSVYMLVLFALILNPYLWDFYGRSVTGNLNSRLMWSVPLPFILALLSGIVWTSSLPLRRSLSVAVMAGFLILPGSIIHTAGWGPAGLKVPSPDYGIARQVNGMTGAGGLILAPEEISTWIPTLEGARPVVEGRGIYLLQRRKQLNAEAYALRATALELYSLTPARGEAVMQAIATLDVDAILVPAGSPAFALVTSSQTELGFLTRAEVGAYILFAK